MDTGKDGIGEARRRERWMTGTEEDEESVDKENHERKKDEAGKEGRQKECRRKETEKVICR